MAKKIKKKLRKNTPKIKAQNGILNRIKFVESYTSLILGAIVVLIVGILFISFAKENKNKQISFVSDISKIEQQISQDSQVSSTYTIKPGDDLWTISETVYKDGYKWVEIAKLNNLENPGMIRAGDKLVISTVAPVISQAQNLDQSPPVQNSIVQNNSITGDTYAVVSGDNLWDIAVRAYGDGFRWPEIAKINKLENPNLIFSGNVLEIPR